MTGMKPSRPSPQSGSAFFIILVGIAMFASLSYVVFKGSHVSESTLSTDRARIAAQEIVTYGDTLARAVQALKLRGCQDTQFHFANSAWKNGNGTNAQEANPVAAAGCGVFVTGEGNVQAMTFPVDYFDSGTHDTAQGSSRVRVASFLGIGDETQEEVFYNLPAVRNDICLAINTLLDIGTAGGNLPAIAEGTTADYKGVFSATAVSAYTDTNGKLGGKTAFCARTADGNKFFRVLIAR